MENSRTMSRWSENNFVVKIHLTKLGNWSQDLNMADRGSNESASIKPVANNVNIQQTLHRRSEVLVNQRDLQMR